MKAVSNQMPSQPASTRRVRQNRSVASARATPAARCSGDRALCPLGTNEIVGVFVEDGLEILIDTVSQTAMRVAMVGAAGSVPRRIREFHISAIERRACRNSAHVKRHAPELSASNLQLTLEVGKAA